MIVRLKGIKKVTSKGRTYYYHRKTGKRLLAEAGSAAFYAEVQSLNKMQVKTTRSKPGTWGYLVEQYRQSPNFQNLADSTKKSYNEVFDYLSKIHDLHISAIDEANLLALRDTTFKNRGRTFSNYIATVMSVVFNYGIPRKLCNRNPAWKLEKIRRPRGLKKQNRAWTEDEAAAFLKEAPPAIKLAVMIGVCTGLRLGDIISLKWSSYQDGKINTMQEKTENEVWIPAMKDLSQLLEQTHRKSDTIIVNAYGQPYTKDGFKSSFRTVKLRLEKDGKINKGLTFHGLRTTISQRIAELGGNDRDIMSVTGHRSTDMVRTYVEEADLRRRANRVIENLESHSSGHPTKSRQDH